MKAHLVAIVALFLSLTTTAHAATLSQGMDKFESKRYSDAALIFAEVLESDSDVSLRQQAEFYLAKSLEGLEFPIAALWYYRNIFSAGRGHRFYLESIGQVVELARTLKDDFVIPSILNARFDVDAFEKLDAQKMNAINYMIGALSYRQRKFVEASDFLGAVAKGSEPYLRARYLMGVIRIAKSDNKGAIGLFQEVLNATEADDDDVDEDRRSMRNLSILGQARAHYALGDFAKATALYRSVPRFSKEWFDALFENGWSYFQQEDYGRALGEIESVLSPYFDKRFRPEAYVLAATIYYSNCQWDRTRGMLDSFKDRYETALERLKKYVATERKDNEYYDELVQARSEASESDSKIPLEILRQVRRNGRFLNYHRIIVEIIQEQEKLKSADNWRSTRLARDLKQTLDEQREGFETWTGSWVKKALKNQADVLNQFVNQARIIKFETATSEKEVIEQGGQVAGQQRKRLPRPDIPSDQHQHWDFKGEYWMDELGYYVHGIRKECLEYGVAQ